VGYLPRVWMAPAEVRELRRLVRYRQQLADQRRNTKLRMQALLRDHRLRCQLFRPWTRAWQAWLESTPELSGHSRWLMNEHVEELGRLNAKISHAEARLEEATQADVLVQALLEQSGIGRVTAWTIRAEIGRFDRFRTGKQLSRFCGLSPRNASSGKRQADAGLIQAGNPRLRAVLIEAGHRLRRLDRRWAELSDRMKQNGKPGSVVAAAVANRWMRWLFHQMRPQRPTVTNAG
jgi:transposase